MRPSLRQIEAFLAVADHGTFSRAAERLGTTQPAISQSVRELEATLTLRLFDRTTRRVVLTEAGQAFREQALKGLAELDRAVAQARDHAGLRQGHVRLAAPPLLAATVLPGILATFRTAHPGLTLALADLGTEQIIVQVPSGHADLGLGTFPPGDTDLARHPILHDEMMVFAPPAADLPAAPCWADLAGHPVIALAPSSGLRLLTDLGFAAVGLTLRPAFEVHGIATALALAGAGLGLAILPGYARAALSGPAPTLHARPLTRPTIGREVALIHAQDRSLSPAATTFADHLTRALRKSVP
ncbi:LysR family transcriptional regulator [Paracoccaceae bacterium Fryx2]|nr:LysR family transcriptional regulator [Paracoccaceae bacterium Fryx2]